MFVRGHYQTVHRAGVAHRQAFCDPWIACRCSLSELGGENWRALGTLFHSLCMGAAAGGTPPRPAARRGSHATWRRGTDGAPLSHACTRHLASAAPRSVRQCISKTRLAFRMETRICGMDPSDSLAAPRQRKQSAAEANSSRHLLLGLGVLGLFHSSRTCRSQLGTGLCVEVARPCSNTATLRKGVRRLSLSKTQTCGRSRMADWRFARMRG